MATVIDEMRETADEFFEGVGLEPLPSTEAGAEGFSDMEKLAIAQAFMNAVGALTSTKEHGNLRDRVNAHMVELYDETGAKSFDVKLHGEKVGTYSLTVSRPTESRTESLFGVADREAFAKWPDFGAIAYNFALEHMQEVADWHFGMTGEIPGGCEVTEVTYPGEAGGEVTRSTLRVDSEAVANVLGAELPIAARMLLEGGQDE